MNKMTLLDYWFVLYKRRVLILIITLTAMVTVAVLAALLDPVYEAKAVFFVPKESESIAFFGAPKGSMIRSALSPSPGGDKQKPFLGILKAGIIARLVQKDFPERTLRDIEKNTDVNVSNEFMLEVYARDKDPRRAAGIANAYVKYFNLLMSEYSLPSQSGIISALESKLKEQENKLTEARQALENFQVRHGTANLAEETKQLVSMKASFESQLQKSRVDYNENVKKVAATQRELKREHGIFTTSDLVVTSSLLEKLKGQMVDLESQMAAMRVEKKEAHPEYLVLKQNYEKVRQNTNAEIKRIIESQIQAPSTFYEDLRRQLISLYVENERIAANMQATRQVLRGLEERISEIPRLAKEEESLTLVIGRYSRLVETLKVNLEETKAQTMRAPQVAVVVDEAFPPGDPVFPFLPLNLLVGLMTGLTGGVFYALFVNYLESTREQRLFRLLKDIEASQG